MVFFDLGATLVEIKPDLYEDSARRIAFLCGRPFIPAEELKSAEREEWDARLHENLQWVRTEKDEREYWKQFYKSALKRLGISSDPPSQLIDLLAGRAADPASFTCFPEVFDTLDELRRMGFRLGIISNAFPSARRILEYLGLARWFECITLSYECGCAKPDRDIYLHALQCANARPEEALFVDDRLDFVLGAKGVGIQRPILIDREGRSDGWKGKKISNLREVVAFARALQPLSAAFATSIWTTRVSSGSLTAQEVAHRVSRDHYEVYKVFVASPGDVLREREIVHEVIEEVNGILRGMEKPFRLDVYAWDRHVHPDIGLPQKVILRQIPIEQCDIFIGIFWKRFGMPPGTYRPRDGKPYLSGTEQEIDEAIEARKNSVNGRPIIMLYRKVDPLPDGMTDEDYLQYAKVIEYFRQCEPDGEHPALVIRFEGEQFKPLLLDHLLRAASRLEEDDRRRAGIPPVVPIVLEPGIETDTQTKWLRSVRLRGNPFRYHLAQYEQEDLPFYFVPLGELRVQNLINEEMPWVIYTDAGCGKTALRMMVAARCYPRASDSDVLCIECGLDELGKVLKEAGSLQAVEPVHWACILVQLADHHLPDLDLGITDIPSHPPIRQGPVFIAYAREDRNFVDTLAKDLEAEGIALWYDRKLHAGRRWCKELATHIEASRALVAVLSSNGRASEWVEREALYAIDHSVPVIPYLVAGDDLPIWAVDGQEARSEDELIRALRSPRTTLYTVVSSLSDVRDLLKRLASAATAAGYRRILCLVDEVDELPAVQGQPSKAVRLLGPLMAPALREVRGIAFRYFLPRSVEPFIQEQRRDFRLDRCRVKHVQWTDQDLLRLIRQRMIACSQDSFAPYQSLGELCERTGGLAQSIDKELAALAEGSPRAAIWLANRLIELHCGIDEPPRLIRPETWERVKVDWWLWGRAQILGIWERSDGFRMVGDRIFFQDREVMLSARYHALLRQLVQAGGKVCSKTELARAGWPGDDPKGVSERAVAEAVRRMRKELDKQGIDPSWVETVHGRGYRVREPESKGSPPEPEA